MASVFIEKTGSPEIVVHVYSNESQRIIPAYKYDRMSSTCVKISEKY